MTNKRLGAGLHVAPRLLLDNRDLLWVNVNIISILNVYTQPKILHVLGYVTHLTPPQCCVVGEDFNVKHDAFEPGILTEDGGYYISQWSVDSGMDYVGEPGRATHRAGHVNDLSFSNVPFDKTKVRTDLNCGTDHEKLVTLIPGRGRAPLNNSTTASQRAASHSLQDWHTAVRAKNEAAANLLLLWAHLDNKSLWHGLLAASSQKSTVAAERAEAWLGEMAYDELKFVEAEK